MSTSEKIKNELQSLLDEQKDLLELTNDKKDYINFGTTYQIWYSRAYKVVEALGSERLEEFTSYYHIDPKRKTISTRNYVTQDYINGILTIQLPSYPFKTVDGNNRVKQRVINQIQILRSLGSVYI